MAKQALSEALSPEKSSSSSSSILLPALPESHDHHDLKPSTGLVSDKGLIKPDHQPQISSSSNNLYASSAENIAKLLKSWMRNSPPSKKAKLTSSAATTQSTNTSVSNNFATTTTYGTDSASSEQGTPSNITDPLAKYNGVDLSEAFESLFGFDQSLESSNSDFSGPMSPEASLFQDDIHERKPCPSSASGQLPLSLLEKWLFDEGVNQGKEHQSFSDMIIDENASFFLK